MEVISELKKTKVNLGLTFSKCMLFVLNVIYAIVSVFIITGGVSTSIIFSPFFTDMANGFQMLSVFWIVVGVILLFVALFGFFVVFKESTVLANSYSIAMMLVFIIQILTAIAGFTLMSRSRHMVTDQLDNMMQNYNRKIYNFYDYNNYDGYRLNVDWIQSKFECCGVNGATDWQNYDRFSTPFHFGTTQPYYYPSSDYYYRTNNYYSTTTDESYSPTTTYPSTTTEAPRIDLMPASCCVQYSNYVNLTCEKYHTSGCFEPIYQILSKSIMTIGSLALVSATIQILGVVLGFMYARIIRRQKTQRDVQIWNSYRSSSAYADDHSTATVY